MNKYPLLSIVIPVYNVENYLKECIESIINQDYPRKEVIIVDDGSTDSSGGICDCYDGYGGFVKVYHQTNKGQSGARNTGLEHSNGELITFVDSDDFIAPGMYSDLVNAYLKFDADIAVCSYQKVFSNNSCITIHPTVYKLYKGEDIIKYLDVFSLQVWNKVYKKELVESVGFIEGLIYEDIPFMHAVLLNTNKLVYTDSPFYCYRVGREGSTVSSFKLNRIKAYPYVLDFATFVIKNYSTKDSVAVVKLCSNFFIQQYMECSLLLNDKKVLGEILLYYKKIVKHLSFIKMDYYAKVFYLSPSVFMFLKKLRLK